MMEPIPDHAELAGAFDEAAPLLDPWPYAKAKFRTHRDGVEVSLTVEPGYRECRLSLTTDGHELVDLALYGVRSVTVDGDVLRLDFVADRANPLWLRLRPDVFLGWSPADRG